METAQLLQYLLQGLLQELLEVELVLVLVAGGELVLDPALELLPVVLEWG